MIWTVAPVGIGGISEMHHLWTCEKGVVVWALTGPTDTASLAVFGKIPSQSLVGG